MSAEDIIEECLSHYKRVLVICPDFDTLDKIRDNVRDKMSSFSSSWREYRKSLLFGSSYTARVDFILSKNKIEPGTSYSKAVIVNSPDYDTTELKYALIQTNGTIEHVEHE